MVGLARYSAGSRFECTLTIHTTPLLRDPPPLGRPAIPGGGEICLVCCTLVGQKRERTHVFVQAVPQEAVAVGEDVIKMRGVPPPHTTGDM